MGGEVGIHEVPVDVSVPVHAAGGAERSAHWDQPQQQYPVGERGQQQNERCRDKRTEFETQDAVVVHTVVGWDPT